ncbi:hypothetical protein V9T40_005373 [Parthenolecanium corni]|uniref:RING-type domain-containing protein n=1 Tax=Parthenolecanium corni TaxID=536013 RepID=A0AAN9Y393_9HEMI
MLQNSSERQLLNSSDASKPDNEDLLSEDEIEPMLKYERLCNDVQTTAQKEAVSCITFNSKIICVGTLWGLVHVFNHLGKRIHIEHMKAHTVAVNQINLDASGDFIATCADDGKAYVYGLYTVDHQLQFTTENPVYSVAIDPHYSKLGTNRRFITGSDRLLLHEKSYFMSAMRTNALQRSIGSVENLKWYGRFVAYAYQNNVRIYDIEERKLVGLIQWDQPEDNETLDRYSCCLTWKNSTTLLIGWLRTFRICHIERRHSTTKESPTFMINVVITMKVDCFICGICPLDVTQLVILANRKKRTSGRASAPRLHLFQCENSKYVEVHFDTLSLRSYRLYTCDDYHLEHCHNENKFIIACPKDVVIAAPYSDDERIDWLVAHNKFEEAMALATAKQEYLQRNTPFQVGQKYINYLLSRHEYGLAGQICAQVLGEDKDLWEKEAFKFARAGQLRAISQYLPADPQHKLDPHIYEMALCECMKREPKKFEDIIQKWSPQLYNVDDVKGAVREIVVSCPDMEKMLLETLDALLTHSKPYEEALDFFIAVKYKGVFEYIQENKLEKKLYGKLNGLLDVDPQQAVNFLVNGERLNVDEVVSELQTNKYYQYLYLDALNTNSKLEAHKYHDLLVKLYAEFCPAKLLPLLRCSRYYLLPEALTVCEKHNLYREVVHLLSRMGGSGTEKALNVLLHTVDDMEMATLFCEKHHDFELWQKLIEHYKAKPEFIEYFLPRIDQYLDARMLIRRIDDRVPIADLRHCLKDKMDQCRQKISIEESCKNIFMSDSNYAFKSFVSMQKHGHRVDNDFICNVCNQKVLPENNFNNIIIFLCSHIFHEKCLSSTGNLKICVVCVASNSKIYC